MSTDKMKEDFNKPIVYEAGGIDITLTPSIVQTYCVGAGGGTITVKEYKEFVELCRARKLNPFLREAYCIKFGSQPAQIVVGKDALIKRADHHPKYDGMESGIIVYNTANGTVEERNGTFYIENTEKVIGGWCRVHRKDRGYPIYVSVAYHEAVGKKSNGEINSMWRKMPAVMCEKTAISRALRMTFPEELNGMYESDEIITDDYKETSTDEPIPQGEPEETETIDAQSGEELTEAEKDALYEDAQPIGFDEL